MIRFRWLTKVADYGVIGDEAVTSTSKGRAYGVEFQARISSTKYNLNMSYTLVRSEFQDGTGKYLVSAWDSKHILSMTGTAALKAQLASWRTVPFCWRIALYSLGFEPLVADYGLECARWSVFRQHEAECQSFRGFSHQLDIRVDKSYYLKKTTLKVLPRYSEPVQFSVAIDRSGVA